MRPLSSYGPFGERRPEIAGTCITIALTRASIDATTIALPPAELEPHKPMRSGSTPGSPCKYDIALRTSSTCFNGNSRVRLITTSAFLRVKRVPSSFLTRSFSETNPSLPPQPR